MAPNADRTQCIPCTELEVLNVVDGIGVCEPIKCPEYTMLNTGITGHPITHYILVLDGSSSMTW
jgi:hypothetical protein